LNLEYTISTLDLAAPSVIANGQLYTAHEGLNKNIFVN
jgi:hypothetical protein